jgi:hypothetical protein
MLYFFQKWFVNLLCKGKLFGTLGVWLDIINLGKIYSKFDFFFLDNSKFEFNIKYDMKLNFVYRVSVSK